MPSNGTPCEESAPSQGKTTKNGKTFCDDCALRLSRWAGRIVGQRRPSRVGRGRLFGPCSQQGPAELAEVVQAQ